jgi:hypothetical protein
METTKRAISNVVARTTEKYLSFSIRKFKFVDSMNFLGISIEKLSEILEKSKAYEYTKKFMPSDKQHLLNRRLRMPYEWVRFI